MAKRAPANPDKFEEASKWFRARTPVTKAEWELMSVQARRQAFTIAGTQQLKVVQTVFDSLQKAIDEGTPIDKWRKELRKKLGDEFTSKNSATLTTAFINANQTAYSTGRWYQLTDPSVTQTLPMWMFDAVLDSRTCFAAGTPVRMADGTTKSIDVVYPGDTVVSCIGNRRRVVATLVTPKRVWGDITLSNGKQLRVTPNHPILTASGWIPARLLRLGDALVVEENQLQSLWEGIPETGQRVPTRLLKRLRKRAEQKVQEASLQSVRSSVREPARNVASLQRSLQRGVAETGELQDLQEALPALTGEQAVLQRRMQSYNEDVRVVQPAVQMPPVIREQGPVPILFGRVQACGETRRPSEVGDPEVVPEMRGAVYSEPGEQTSAALLSLLPDASKAEVRSLWKPGPAAKKQVLLAKLLPQVDWRDGARSGDQAGFGGARHQTGAGSKDRPMVGRLSDSEQSRVGSRRDVLAQGPEGLCPGCAPRQAAFGTRFLGGQNQRFGVQQGSGVRDARALGIWPIPGHQVAQASTTTVVGVDWQLTPEPEPAYDIQVDEDAGFIANGIVVHNSTICLECAGTIRRFDDGWWLAHWPPLHHRCRSTVRGLTESMANRKGGPTETLPRPEIKGDFGLAPPLRAGQVWEPDRAKYDPSAFREYEKKLASMKAANDNAKQLSEPSKRLGDVGEKVFGRKLTDTEIDDLAGLRARLPPGYSVDVSLRESAKKESVTLNGFIKSDDGTVVGSFSRDYTRASGVTNVHHAAFFVDEKLQGTGIGRSLFNAQIDAYEKHGIANVTLDAANVGKYVWSKAGFDWSDAADIASARKQLGSQLKTELGAKAARKVMKEVQTPEDIARVVVGQQRIGKQLLIDMDTGGKSIPMSQVPSKIKRL